MEPGLTGAGSANDQHVFVDVVFWYLVPADHDPFRLGQEDIIVKLGIDKRLYIFCVAP